MSKPHEGRKDVVPPAIGTQNLFDLARSVSPSDRREVVEMARKARQIEPVRNGSKAERAERRREERRQRKLAARDAKTLD